MLVRFLAEDDPVQLVIAQRVVAGGCYVTATVLLETTWVLSSCFAWPRTVITQAFLGFFDIPMVDIPGDGFRWAVRRYNEGADFADMLHLVESSVAGRFATFDRKIAKFAGSEAPVVIETLG